MHIKQVPCMHHDPVLPRFVQNQGKACMHPSNTIARQSLPVDPGRPGGAKPPAG